MIGAVRRIRDATEAIAGVNVQVFAGGALCGQAVTDANGSFEIVMSADGAAGSCNATGDGLTFQVNGDPPVKAEALPRGNVTIVLIFVQ